MSRKFYVASKFENQKEVGKVIDYLTSLGYINTYDWRKGHPSQDDAIKDMNGVKEADFVVGIFTTDYAYKGAIAEIGMAMVLNKPVFILGNWLDNMIFMMLPWVYKIDNISQIVNHSKW